MLRYKTETRPDLVTLYDIWPGNGAGLFLQPRSLHGASNCWDKLSVTMQVQPNENGALSHTVDKRHIMSQVGWQFLSQKQQQQLSCLSLRFKGHFPGEPGLAGVY